MYEYGGLFTLAIWLPLLAVGIVVQVFFLLNLRDVLRQVGPQNQKMAPNLVWLNFIPLFGIAWMFITVIRVRDSVRAEFVTRGWAPHGDYGFGVGLAYAILSIFLGLFTVVPFLICWGIYWSRTSELKNQLMHGRPPLGWVPSPPSPGQRGPTGYGSSPGMVGSVPPGLRRSCSACGAGVQPGDEFCRTCGVHLDVTVGADLGAAPSGEPAPADLLAPPAAVTDSSCPFCGAPYRPNAQFCSVCGRPAV
jgi:hypothetical protein